LKQNGKVTVWNKGQKIGQKPPLTQKQLSAISRKLKAVNNLRDLVLFNLALESSLGATDLVQLQLKDLSKKGEILPRVALTSAQTGNAVQFEISEATRSLIAQWVAEKNLKPSSYLFASRILDSPHISARQYARIVADWIRLIGLDPKDYSAQSLRRSKPMLIFNRTKNLDAAMAQLGHARLRSTVRFLGIELN